jgi:hypothetical protein
MRLEWATVRMPMRDREVTLSGLTLRFGEAAHVPSLPEVASLVGGDGVEPFAPERAQDGAPHILGPVSEQVRKKGRPSLPIALRRISR